MKSPKELLLENFKSEDIINMYKNYNDSTLSDNNLKFIKLLNDYPTNIRRNLAKNILEDVTFFILLNEVDNIKTNLQNTKELLINLQKECGYGSNWWIKIETVINPNNPCLRETNDY